MQLLSFVLSILSTWYDQFKVGVISTPRYVYGSV